MLVPTTILAQQHFGTFAERLKDYPFTIEHVSRFRAAEGPEARDRGLRQRHRRHPHRHAPPAQPRRAREGPRADHRRRGAALRRQAEGAAAPAQAQGRRHRDERDADPAHAADVAGRPARHHGHRDAARGPAPDQDLRRRVRRGARQAGAAAREGARRPGVLPAQPRRDDRRDRRAPARAVPGHDASRSPTASSTRRQLEKRMLAFLRGDADVLVATSIIESGIDIPQANTLIVERADMFGLSQLYQIRGRVGRSRERAYAYLLYPSAAALTPEAAQPPQRAVGLHRARRRLQGRDARPRAARRGQPARRRAVRPRRRARLRALHADARRGGRRAWPRTAAARTCPSRSASTSTSTPTCPADYVPYEQAKVDVHRRIAGAYEVAELEQLRDELEDRFGPLPEPLREPHLAPAGPHQARPGGRARGVLQGEPARCHTGRARLGPRSRSSGRRFRGRSTSRASRRSRYASPTIPSSDSRPSSAPRTCCSRSPERPLKQLDNA